MTLLTSVSQNLCVMTSCGWGAVRGRTTPCLWRCLRMSRMESSSWRNVSSSLLLLWARRFQRSTSGCPSVSNDCHEPPITCKERTESSWRYSILCSLFTSWGQCSNVGVLVFVFLFCDICVHPLKNKMTHLKGFILVNKWWLWWLSLAPYDVIWMKPIKNSKSGVRWYETTLLCSASSSLSQVHFTLLHLTKRIVTKVNVIIKERQRASELCLMFTHFSAACVRHVCVTNKS